MNRYCRISAENSRRQSIVNVGKDARSSSSLPYPSARSGRWQELHRARPGVRVGAWPVVNEAELLDPFLEAQLLDFEQHVIDRRGDSSHRAG